MDDLYVKTEEPGSRMSGPEQHGPPRSIRERVEGRREASPHTVTASELSVGKRFLSREIYEVNSGVSFSASAGNVVARLGDKRVDLPTVPVSSLEAARVSGSFDQHLVDAFNQVVMPALLSPVLETLKEEIRQFIECGYRDRRDGSPSGVTDVQVLQAEPYEFSMKGLLRSVWSCAEYEASVIWSTSGSVNIVGNNKSLRVPVSRIIGDDSGILRRLIGEVGRLYAQA